MEHWQSKAAIGIGLGLVAGYEAACPKEEFITDEVRRIRKHKVGNAIVQAAVWSTAMHLSGGFEKLGMESIDPFRGIGVVGRKIKGIVQ